MINVAPSEDGGGEVAQLLLTLWLRKKLIALGTIVSIAFGSAYAFLAKPYYYAEATITLKDMGKGIEASRLFSQLGGMGGVVSAQLGLGNTNLDKIQVVLGGHELAETVIQKNNLLPVLFPKEWDAEKGAWKAGDPSKYPTIREGEKKILKRILSLDLDAKRNMLHIGALFPDPVVAKSLVEMYLAELNLKIRTDVIKDAQINREYLQGQLNHTVDPTLIEKIQNMIGNEIEKSMFVSSNPFEILQGPLLPDEPAKPRRFAIIAIALSIGLVASSVAALVWNAIAPLLYRPHDNGT